MSVLMIMRVPVDPARFEEVARDNDETIRGIAERAQGRGAIHHAFYAGDGEMVVLDEWDSPESFQAFFEAEAPNIGPLMEAAGAGQPSPSFYTKLDTPDEF